MTAPVTDPPALAADPTDELRSALRNLAADPDTDVRVRAWLRALVDDPTGSPTYHPTRPATVTAEPTA